jgi:hypothetical protein
MVALVGVVALLEASLLRISCPHTCSRGNRRSGSPGSGDVDTFGVVLPLSGIVLKQAVAGGV